VKSYRELWIVFTLGLRTFGYFLLALTSPSFSACADQTSLGRIIVHDRIQVEAKVLPRYFNHSSFASLRRQLNYFNFVRLGKGRQRESTYTNENVVRLDDILHLKRRSTTGNSMNAQVDANASTKERLYVDPTATIGQGYHMDYEVPILDPQNSVDASESVHCRKRPRQTREFKPTTVSPRSTSPVDSCLASVDDEHYFDGMKSIALDLTRPELRADEDVLAGCKNLLYLASKGWD
jgi:hypothetical protein